MAALEIWKDIKSYEGLYEVSNRGRVKSLKWTKDKILKPKISNAGYCLIPLWKNGKSKTFPIHRLVYQSFIGELIKGLVVDHISGDRIQNSVENLQQISYRENTVRGNVTKNSTSKYPGVNWEKSKNKWKSRISLNGKKKHLGLFESELEAAQAYEQALKTI
jgi:hypothetical protein